jgi:hypothetical protein
MPSKSDWSNLRPDGTPFRDGLDDGPPLPSQAVRDRASAKIDAERLITDAERINWLESVKYGQFGIGFDGHKYQVEVRVKQKRFFGRSLRAAVDEAIRSEWK